MARVNVRVSAIRAVCSFIKVLTYMNQTLRELKTKEKSSSVIPKVIVVAYRSGRLREVFIKEFE